MYFKLCQSAIENDHIKVVNLMTFLNSAPDLLVLAQRDGVLLVLVVLLLIAVLGRIGGRRRRCISLRSTAVTRAPIWIAGKELSEVARVGVRELLRDQSLVQGADGVAPLASPWSYWGKKRVSQHYVTFRVRF